MHRHILIGPVRTHRCPRRGFTLVELLVVIAIIAMLVGLLVPAAIRAREAGRRATCLNNQQQLGKAMVNYVTQKNKFPPLLAAQPNYAPGGNPPVVGWVPNMLPLIEQNPLYLIFQSNGWTTGSIQNAEVEVLICPSRDPTFSPAPLSYCLNAGMRDAPIYAAMSPGHPLDYTQNGLFFDAYAPIANPPIKATPPIDISYVNKHDGTSTTLLLSENLDALDWIKLPTSQFWPTGQAPPLPVYTAGPSNPENGESWWQAMIWFIDTTVGPPNNWGTNVAPTNILLNKNAGGTVRNDQVNARPSSNHPGGFIVTFVDGHSTFINESIEYRVYCQLMTPDGAAAVNPIDGTPIIYPLNWYNGMNMANPLVPVTAADIE